MQVSFTPSPELFPFQSRWFEADGIRMHYVDEGGGRPILMCHGNPTWSFLYRKVIPRLRDHFRCVAVDFPGFGLSDRPEGTATRLPSTPRSWASSGITCNSRSSSSWARIGVAPIGMWDAAERADRIHGMIFMNIWFWPADRLRMQVFSRVMASPVAMGHPPAQPLRRGHHPALGDPPLEPGRDGSLSRATADARSTSWSCGVSPPDTRRPPLAATFGRASTERAPR